MTAGEHGLPAAAAEALRRWRAPDAAQHALREGFVEQLRRHEDAVWRSGPPEHLTASCAVLDDTCTRTLLVLHGKARRWFQPGGHLEAGDVDLRAGAAREAREESGIADLDVLADPVQLDRHALPGAFGRCREHLDVRFVAVAPPGALPATSEESLDVAWVDLADAPAELAPLLDLAVAAVRRARAEAASTASPA